jgi:DNA-binding XRE family transcriptional regulator
VREIWEEWGRRLRDARRDAGYTQVTFAAALEISQQRISQFEKGLAAPRDELKIRIAQRLGCQVRKLFPLGDEDAAA